MSDRELFLHRLAALLHERHPPRLLDELTHEEFRDWELFYEQDMWGEVRNDLRAMAMVLNINNPQTEVSMGYPYFELDDDLVERHEAMEKRKKAMLLDPDAMAALQARLKADREKYFAEKEKRRGG